MVKTSGKTIAMWVLAVAVAGMFVMSSIPKLQGADEIRQAFENWGYPASFVLLIGVLEMLGAILALIPRVATFGAAILVIVMGGAVFTHFSTGIGSPWMALLMLALAAVLGWLRKDDALFLSAD